MEFPRVGLVRDLTTDAVLITWSYPLGEGGEDVMTGDCPYIDFDPERHEILDLTEYSYEQYVKITTHQEEATVKKQGNSLEFRRNGKGGGPPTDHEVGRPERKPPPVDPEEPPVAPEGEEPVTEVSNP